MKVWEVKIQYVSDDACEAGGELRLFDNYDDALKHYKELEQSELTYANDHNLEVEYGEEWFSSWEDQSWWGEHTEISLDEKEIGLPETDAPKVGLIYTSIL